MKTDYEIYVEKYAAKHRISISEAKTHEIVKAYYDEVGDRITNQQGRPLGEITETNNDIGGC